MASSGGAGRHRAGDASLALRRVALGFVRLRPDVPCALRATMVILRPSFAYGPGQEATKLVPHVITKLLAGQSPSSARVIECSTSSSRPTSPRPISRRPWHPTSRARRSTSAPGTSRPSVRSSRPSSSSSGPRRVRLCSAAYRSGRSSSRSRSTPRWRQRSDGAQTPLVEGLRQTIAWYRAAVPSGGA